MPRGDRSGPEGAGQMTGRALGYCAGFDAPGYAHPGPGAGRMERGAGGRRYMVRDMLRIRGYGWNGPGLRRRASGYAGYPTGYPAPPTTEEELRYLQDNLEYLNRELKTTEERIRDLQREEADQSG